MCRSGRKRYINFFDSLMPIKQDSINVLKSWYKAIKSIALFSKYLDPENSFASLGCVLQKENIDDVKKIIKFGTKIGWFTSLVPIHITNQVKPRGFRTFDQSLKFENNDYQKVDTLLEEIKI